jgi:hypothetical protein
MPPDRAALGNRAIGGTAEAERAYHGSHVGCRRSRPAVKTSSDSRARQALISSFKIDSLHRVGDAH